MNSSIYLALLGTIIALIYKKKKKKKKKNNNNNNSVTILEEDLILYQILPRLPIHQLFTLRLVCKNWHNLIPTDPLLISRHFHHNRPHYLSTSAACFPYYNVGCFTIPLGITDGLLYGFCENSDVFLCNTFTKHVMRIPNHDNSLGIALADCDLLFENPGDDFAFTVVAMTPVRDPEFITNIFQFQGVTNTFQFQVYSSRTGEWRLSKISDFEVPCCLRGNGGVYNGRKVFWSFVTHIVWYDIDDDDAGIFESPRSYENGMAYCGVGVCHDNGGGGGGGELSFSNFTLEGQLQIWLLRNFDKERSGGNGNESVRGEFTRVKIHCLNLMKWEVLSKYIHTEEMWSYGKFLAIKNATITPLSYVGGEVVWFRKDAGGEVKYFLINLRTKNLKLINHDDMPLAILPFIPHHLPCPI